MSGARAVTSLELRRHLKNTFSNTSPKNVPSSSNSNSPVKTIKRLTKVRRDLFGPIDRDETTRFIESEMTCKQTQDSERWGFDFTRGVPLVNNENYEWEPVYTFIPQYYKMQHSRERLSSSKSTENQLQYFQNPDDLPEMDIDKKLFEELEPKHRSDACIDIIERTPLQSHSSNKTSKKTSTQPPKKFRQICITDLLENRKRINNKTNVSSTNKSTVSSTISQIASCSSSNNINNCLDNVKDGVQAKKPKYSINNSM